MITQVCKHSWVDPDGKSRWAYTIYYRGKKRITRVKYTDQQTLPDTVIQYVMNADRCDVTYAPDSEFSTHKSVKWETYSQVPGMEGR